MDIRALTLLLQDRWQQLKSARDAGQSSTEVAVFAAVLIVVAGGIALAIKTKVAEKIGIINGG
ncbi:hypothetical protein [Streptomyces sp. CBMA152]|uniref:hypothetical protein n=1 Tax=Streptomyces sp. CBMA152 TaxID=1896312 RepID=UPI001660FC3C|nr:hypothetical protein [Streptomyces sp. CBMA152]MBD0742958.1 hypothetical protein [Streptomyces sp. CBMA152]